MFSALKSLIKARAFALKAHWFHGKTIKGSSSECRLNENEVFKELMESDMNSEVFKLAGDVENT